MSDQQLYLAIGLPALIAIFNTGIVVTLLLHFTNKLDAKIDTTRSELSGKIDSMQRDMREFYASQRQHDTRLEALERKVDLS